MSPGVEVQMQERLGEVVPEEGPKITGEEVAEGLPAQVPGGPRRSVRKVGRPNKYTE